MQRVYTRAVGTVVLTVGVCHRSPRARLSAIDMAVPQQRDKLDAGVAVMFCRRSPRARLSAIDMAAPLRWPEPLL